jgi:hypothetical protein
VPFDLPAGEVIMLGEKTGPAGVAEFSQPLGRADDVGEQDGRKDPVQAWPVPLAGQERLHLIDDRIHVAGVGRVIAAAESYHFCTADLRAHVGRDLRRHGHGPGGGATPAWGRG